MTSSNHDVRTSLTSWFGERLHADAVEIDDVVHHTDGFSWQTYTMTVRWRQADGAVAARGFAVRREPEDGVLAPYDVAAQYALHRALTRQPGVPVPELFGLRYGWRLEAKPDALLRTAAELVNGEPIGIYQDAGERDWLPADTPHRRFRNLATLTRSRHRGAIVVTDRRLEPATAAHAVVWRPRRLVLGVGCSSDAPADELDALLRDVVAEQSGKVEPGPRRFRSTPARSREIQRTMSDLAVEMRILAARRAELQWMQQQLGGKS